MEQKDKEYPCDDCKAMENDRCFNPLVCNKYMKWVLQGIKLDAESENT